MWNGDWRRISTVYMRGGGGGGFGGGGVGWDILLSAG